MNKLGSEEYFAMLFFSQFILAKAGAGAPFMDYEN